jgi:hypothetical protein
VYLEEVAGATINLVINEINITMPASWHILVVDPDTRLVDTIPVAQCVYNEYKALMIGTINSRYIDSTIKVLELDSNDNVQVYPKISKGTMMLHPAGLEIGNEENVLSIVVGPYDLYDRYLQDVSARELLY